MPASSRVLLLVDIPKLGVTSVDGHVVSHNGGAHVRDNEHHGGDGDGEEEKVTEKCHIEGLIVGDQCIEKVDNEVGVVEKVQTRVRAPKTTVPTETAEKADNLTVERDKLEPQLDTVLAWAYFLPSHEMVHLLKEKSLLKMCVVNAEEKVESQDGTSYQLGKEG